MSKVKTVFWALVERIENSMRDLAWRLREGARTESRRRRRAWAGIAALIVLGPLAFNLSRESSFTASVDLFPRPVEPYPAIPDPAYYLALLKDPELHKQMRIHRAENLADYDDVTLRRAPGDGSLRLTAAAETPPRAQDFVNELAPQISGATRRQLARRASADAARLRRDLRSPRSDSEAVAIRRRLREITRLGPLPPDRTLVGPRASLPRLERWADRVANAMPGAFPVRPAAVAPAVSGLLVVATLWAIGLALFPPGGRGGPTDVSRPPPTRRSVRPRPEPVPRSHAGAPAGVADRGDPELAATTSTAVGRRGAIVGIAVLVCAGLFVLWAGRGINFLEDEWTFVFSRRGGDLDTFLQPHNEHFVLGPVVAFKLLFATAGLSEYWPYRLIVVLAHLGCVALVFTIARRRIGVLMGALLTAPILVFGPGWEVLLFGFNGLWIGSILAGLGMLIALDRGDRRGDIAASVLLWVSLASSSFGVPFALGAAVEILWRKDRWQRAWIVAVPVLLYGAWYLGFNLDPTREGPVEILKAPVFAFHAARGVLSALYGLPLGVETERRGFHGVLVLMSYLTLLAAVVVLVRRVRQIGGLTPRLAMLITTLGSFWLLTGAARAYSEQWYAGRYVYPAAVLVLILVAEAAKGLVLPRRFVAVAILAAVGVGTLNAAWLVKDGKGRRADAGVLSAELGAVEIARARLAPDFPIDDKRAKFVTARAYFDATKSLGSPALSPGELADAPAMARGGADRLLLRAVVRVRRFDRASPRAPVTSRLSGSAAPFVRRGEGCIFVRAPSGRAVTATLILPRQGIAVQAAEPQDFRLGLRRFGSTYQPAGRVLDPAGDRQLITAAPDRSRKPWSAQISSTGRFSLC